MKIITLILLFSCRFCTCEYPVHNDDTTKIRRNAPRTQLNRETGPRQLPLTPLPGGSHANIHGPNAQRTPPPRSRGLRDTTTRGTFPGAKPTVTQTAVGRGTTKVTVNSRPNTHPDIEDIGEDPEEDLKHVKTYHENMQETAKTTLEVTSTAEPKEPLEYKMDMTLVTVGKSTEGVTFYEYTHDEVTYKTFKPKDDKSVVEIVDGKSQVWKSSSGKCIDAWTYSTDISSLCRLDILSSGIITPHCFEKRGNVWIALDFKLYTEKLKKLVTHLSTNIRVDFRGVSRDLCHVLDYFDARVLTTTVFPRFKATGIYHDNKKIWEPGNGEMCDRAHFASDGRKHLAYLRTPTKPGDTTCISFEYTQDGWIEGNPYNFGHEHYALCPLPDEVFNGKLVDTTLDINSVDNTIRIYNYSYSMVTHFEYQTPMNANVTRVIDGAQITVWQGGEDDRCLSCEVYSREGYYPVLWLVIKNRYRTFTKYFENNRDEWKDINEETFNLRLASLSNNSRLQLLKDRLVDMSENADVFDRKTSYTSEEINMLYLNQWLLSHVPHWVLDQFKTFYPKGWFSR
ncbi:hypothetical protein BEWA_052720 [Theileria equi strain WA]|uniref:Signal peptide containing protein n=1 Tax=Theileria equi strain WA TaxID=1537102 RepID=L1LCQ7_THEEQ|nr:hypothetical protein BEWA_052720 [Theileria equi strain WA]EKX73217.1 hypothetical protein BEWA_052720 [Theileria equi strain WA]|eukprot:XP_004832669.1 hypothetical protein BEWA_052720 [Theileria equi strain WA]